MSNFGYPQQYANGLNNNSQIRRSTDMIYQRGATYEVVLTGDTYVSSMQLNVDLYGNDNQVGRMSLVPFDVQQTGSTYTYKFNLRPYSYLSNYIQSEHYGYYYLNDWFTTNNTININNPYPNIIKANYKYGYQYLSGATVVTEYTGSPVNNITHYNETPVSTGSTASGYINTGYYFNYLGGSFQMDTDRYLLPNYDQEVGTAMGTGTTINTVSSYRDTSPITQFFIYNPTLQQPSQTSRFLTEAPRIQQIQNDENYVLYYLNGQTGDRQVMESDYVVIRFYDSSNNQINYLNQQLNFSGTTYASPTGYTDNLSIFSLPCGPVDINNLYATIDFSSVAYYTVQLYYSYPTNDIRRVTLGPVGPSSEMFYFYLYDNCLPENTRLVFLNSRGGFDYYTFQSYRNDTKSIQRTTYDSRYYSTNLNSPDRDYGRSTKTFDTNVNQDIVLESNYLSVEEGNWLEELFYSPQVYIMKKDYISKLDRQDKIYKDLTPVTVMSSEVETITKKHKKLNKYRVTLRTANNFFVNKGF